jgi:mannose-6-phosphate isomerase-like protein (cupin superfamily)
MKQIIKRILLWKLILIVGYFGIGIILNSYVFPEQKPDLSNYFQPGDILHSTSEGFDQTIISVKDGWVHSSLKIQPKAPGPPEHIHTNLVETFSVKEGTLSIMVNGEKKTVKAGESITIPVGTSHRPFNETDSPVIIENEGSEKDLTVEFAYHLSQLYRVVDGMGGNPSAVAMIMQLSVYGTEMDAYLADGPPIIVQKAMRFLLAPTARLLGYKSYYEEYRMVHHPR